MDTQTQLSIMALGVGFVMGLCTGLLARYDRRYEQGRQSGISEVARIITDQINSDRPKRNKSSTELLGDFKSRAGDKVLYLVEERKDKNKN